MKLKLISILLLSGTLFAQSYTKDFSEAMDFFNDKDFTKAHLLFADILKEKSSDWELLSAAKYYSALSLMHLKQFEGAVSEFEDFIDNYRASSYRDAALYNLGAIYFKNEQYDDCRTRLIMLLNEYPKSEFAGLAYYWIGEAFKAEDKLVEAEDFFNEAVMSREGKSSVDYSLYSLANLYETTEEYANAVTYYDELLAYYSDSQLAPFAQFRIGVCYFSLKEYDRAVLELSDPMIDKLPDDVRKEAEYKLADSFFRLKEFKNAEEIYKSLLSKYNDGSVTEQVKYGLAWINFQMKEYTEAFRRFDELIFADSDTIAANSLYWSGECQRYLGKNEEAIKTYFEFLKQYPENRMAEEVRFNLGVIQYNSGDLKKAERNLIFAIKADNKDISGKALTLLGEIKLVGKDYNAAEEFFKRAIGIAKLKDIYKNRAILGAGVAQYYLDRFDDAAMNLSDLAARFPRFEKNKVNFYLGEAHFANGDFTSAIKNYHRVDVDDENVGGMALYGKAYSFYNIKDFANSAFYFEEYRRRNRNGKFVDDAKLREADSYFGTKNFEKAAELYGDVFNNNRRFRNDFAYYQYGQSLFHSGNSEKAVEVFSDLQTKYSSSKYADDSQYLIGWIHFQQNSFNQAIADYNKLLNTYSSTSIRPIAIYSIGDCFYNLEKYDSALVYYTRITEKYSNTPYVYDAVNGIHYCYMAKDKPAKAIKLIDQYTESNGNTNSADKIFLLKGEIYYSQGEYKKAIASYEEFKEKYPNSSLMPQAHYWIGKSAANKGDKNVAKENFSYLAENHLNSKYGIDAVVELGKLYSDGKQFAEAAKLYADVAEKVDASPRVPELLYLKGLAEVSNKDTAIAYKTFEDIFSFYGGEIFADKAKIELGIIELGRKNYSKAEEYFLTLGEKRMDDIGARAQYLYGYTLFEQNRINEAISAFVRVRSVFAAYDEWYTASLLKLGDSYKKLRDKKKARDMYRAVIKRHPKDDFGAEARKKLNRL